MTSLKAIPQPGRPPHARKRGLALLVTPRVPPEGRASFQKSARPFNLFNEEKCRRADKKEAKMRENQDPMGPPGVEPGTSRLSGVRSNHLSYGP